MAAEQKLALADEIFSSQPNLLGAVLALQRLGVPAAKQDFALEMLFLCYQAMKESGLMWPLITQDELENQMMRHTAVLRFYDSLNGRSEQNSSIRQYIEAHPEQDLLAWVMTSMPGVAFEDQRRRRKRQICLNGSDQPCELYSVRSGPAQLSAAYPVAGRLSSASGEETPK